jgi:membrane protease YdiL (CAAX protease family)
MQKVIRRYPFAFFIFLTLLISWLPWYSGGQGIFVFGPSIAGVIITSVLAGKDGLRDLMRRALKWRVGWKWWCISLFLSALITLVAAGINTLMGASLPPLTFIRQEWYLLPVFFLITIIGGPLGEEFGWRGFALPRLQKRWNPLIASLILGLIWGLWHIPQFFNPAAVHYELGLVRLPLYVLAEMGLATIMTWVYNKTGGSMLLGGLIYHNADNFWGVVLITEATMTTALSASSNAGVDLQLWTISLVVGLVAAGLITVFTRGKLGYKEK